MTDTQRPLAAIVGGSKVSDKILLLESLVGKVDKLFIGGAMANSFIHNVNGVDLGASKLENDLNTKNICKNVVKLAKEKGVDL